jgi:predicted nucleotidyltransferase
MDPKSVNKLEPLLRRLKKAFSPLRVILFGSRSRNDFHEESDYDLLLISPVFNNVLFRNRSIKAYSLRDTLPVDMVCLTPEEFERRKNEISIVGIAAREGVEIAA